MQTSTVFATYSFGNRTANTVPQTWTRQADVRVLTESTPAPLDLEDRFGRFWPCKWVVRNMEQPTTNDLSPGQSHDGASQ